MTENDIVRSTIDGRVGIAGEFMQDDAVGVDWYREDGTTYHEMYKWNHLEKWEKR